MVIRRIAKETLSPVEMDKGDILYFYTAGQGRKVVLRLLDTGAFIVSKKPKPTDTEDTGVLTVYRFHCILEINGKRYHLEREVPTPSSFYPPWRIEGLDIWFDAVSDIFVEDGGFLEEKDSSIGIFCRPGKKARFAIQDAALEICPETLYPWCPLPQGGLKIEECFRGEDCWMGTYDGNLAHGGLDINHPAGTPLWAPLDMDDHCLFHSLEKGHNNNRWRGIRRWDSDTSWILQAHHVTRLNVKEHTGLKKGQKFADGAGVAYGLYEHSHFVFKVETGGKTYFLDPWILFWKMYRDASR